MIMAFKVVYVAGILSLIYISIIGLDSEVFASFAICCFLCLE